MKNIEYEAMLDNLHRMLDNSKEVKEKLETAINAGSNVDVNMGMLMYEKGMMRGLERAISNLCDYEAVTQDYKNSKKRG